MSTAAGNPKPVSSKSIDLLIWNVLGGSPAITFGEECASVAVWTMVALLMRTILYFSFMEPYVPYGLVYAFPMFIEVTNSVLYLLIAQH